MDLYDRVEEAKRFLSGRLEKTPRVAIVLGTGLSGFAQRISVAQTIGYQDIPYFPVPTGVGHKAEAYAGTLGGKDVIAFGGRFHIYEGYDPQAITFPIRVAKAIGCEVLILSNAAGGMNPQFQAADVMVISDHINLTGLNPLVGPNDDRLGPRFPDMSQPYDRELISLFERVALEEKVPLRKGVYVGITGPSLETAAEYRFFRQIGGDAIGMSTVLENIVAVHAGLRVLGISIITDLCLPDALEPVRIEQILENAAEGEKKVSGLVAKFVERLPG